MVGGTTCENCHYVAPGRDRERTPSWCFEFPIPLTPLMGEQNVVLFLGSGFAKGAGLPTMMGFCKATETEWDKQKKEWDGNKKKREEHKWALKVLHPEGMRYLKFATYCNRANKLGTIAVDNLEEVFAVAEILALSGQIVELDGSRLKGTEIRTSIQRWLWTMCHSIFTEVEPEKYRMQARMYGKFANWANGLGNRLSVITTNYDIIFEHHMYRHAGVPCRYPLHSGDSFTPRKIDGESEVYVVGGDANVPSPGPMVCKLHGSVNMFQRKDSKRPLLMDGWGVPKERDQYTCRPTFTQMEPISEFMEKEDYQPAILPPSYAKLENADWVGKI